MCGVCVRENPRILMQISINFIKNKANFDTD